MVATNKTIIVIGGSHSGANAASKARQFNENAHIVLIEQGPLVTWAQTSLRHHLLSDEDKITKSLLADEACFSRRYNVDIRTNTRALSLDLDAHCLLVECKQQRERIMFDSLIFAGGAASKKLEIPGLAGPRVVSFRNTDDIDSIKKALREGAKRAAVIGCGFYGVEAALGLKAAGFDVTVIESKHRIMPKFSIQFAQIILAKLSEQGISVKLYSAISTALELPDASFELTLSGDSHINADVVVVSIGSAPRTSILGDAGAALDPEGFIRVDDHMATTLPNVYACGSVASIPHAISGDRICMLQPAIALRTAHIAGHNAAIDDTSEMDSLGPYCGSLIAEIGDTSFARTGLQEHEARKLLGDKNIVTTTVMGSAAETMCVKLLLDKGNRRIIGGEIFGTCGVPHRIDLVSAAVLEGWPPERLIDLDMAYTVNSSPVFDPLKDAAMRAKLALAEKTQVMSAEMLALWLANDQDFYLVDVSDTPLLSGQSPQKSIHLPLEALRDRVDELADHGTPIVLYSRSGHCSHLAQQALMQRGLTNVYHLDGGAAAWQLLTPTGGKAIG